MSVLLSGFEGVLEGVEADLFVLIYVMGRTGILLKALWRPATSRHVDSAVSLT